MFLRSRHPAPLAVAAVLLAACAVGCTRGRYYAQADREVSTLLAEKACDPRWKLPANYNIRQDQRSRFYDVYSQILPPMPPDDPTAHRFMHCVDGKKGWPRWHANGDRTTLDNPDWRSRLPEIVELTESGAVKLTLDSALRLAYLNSIDWQNEQEELYLSALDVSTERFAFDVQFYGGNATRYKNIGPLGTGGPSATWSTDTSLEARKYFATAGQLMVGVVNSIMWQFAGPDRYRNVSLVNFNLVQPLLRRAGRAWALEPLTIVERTLLANLRSLQFYRQGFFLQVAFGLPAGQGVQRRGGFFGGTGFEGFTGTGIGGFGNVGGTFFGGGLLGFPGAGGGGGGVGVAGGDVGNLGGFFGLLQARQRIRNLEQLLADQQRSLAKLEEQLDAGLIDLTQVDQLRQNVETNRAKLATAKTSLTDTLESYKVNTLCIPADTPVALDEEFIKPFQFISPELLSLQNAAGTFLAKELAGAEETLRATEDPRTAEPAPALELPPPEDDAEIEAREGAAARGVIRASIAKLGDLRRRVEEQVAIVAGDLERVKTTARGRLAGLKPTERETFDREMRLLAEDLTAVLARARKAEDEIAAVQSRPADVDIRANAARIAGLVADVAGAVDELSLIQARARVEAVSVDAERLDPDVAFEIARANRLDWMNARAALVDQWRLIQYNAVKLKAGLDLKLEGDISTTGNNAARFRAPTGSLSAGVQFDPPLTRLQERNDFRQAIIQYQQQRRRQIRFEDQVKLGLRQMLRQLELDRMNLETQRRAVIIAIRRVDETRLTLAQPAPPPPAADGPAAAEPATDQLGPTTIINYVTATDALQASQDALTSVWLRYYRTRAMVARELGIMQLSDDGMWIDTPLCMAEREAADVALPPAIPDEWLEHLEEVQSPPPLGAAADGLPAAEPLPVPTAVELP
jgi:outer membrane protein TolC